MLFNKLWNFMKIFNIFNSLLEILPSELER